MIGKHHRGKGCGREPGQFDDTDAVENIGHGPVYRGSGEGKPDGGEVVRSPRLRRTPAVPGTREKCLFRGIGLNSFRAAGATSSRVRRGKQRC
jgi:hypothetical protein